MADPLRIEVHGTSDGRLGRAVISVRVNGRQVAQLDQCAPTSAEAMRGALADAIAVIAKEEVRHGR